MGFTIAIIGKPNVGKSSLFNKILRLNNSSLKSITAITAKVPGVTRDRNYGFVVYNGKKLTIIDTGGFYPDQSTYKENELEQQVKEQSFLAIQEADLIIHLLDGKESLTPVDLEIANILRKTSKPILWVVNKIDSFQKEEKVLEFYDIGAKEIIPISAITGYGFDELMDKISFFTERLPDDIENDYANIAKVAVVGKPNVGKSTLINTLLNKNRLVVNAIAGTTRDAIDTPCSYYGKKYLFVDTAGIKKNLKSLQNTKQFSLDNLIFFRTIKAIERSDVVIVVIDAVDGITEQDQKIIGLAEEMGKGIILFLNKWDLIENPEIEYKALSKKIKLKIWFADYTPFLTASAFGKKRITKIFPLIDEIISFREKRIPTPELNRFASMLYKSGNAPTYKGKDARILYIAQIDIKPPIFKIFANYPKAFKSQHIKYIERAIRTKYLFTGTPLRIYCSRQKEKV